MNALALPGTAPVAPYKAKPIARGKLPDDVDMERLSAAIVGSRRHLQKFRAERVKAVQELVGWHYSDGGSDKPVPVNLLYLYVSIMSSALISQDPKFMLSTMDPKQRAAVDAAETWLNDESGRMYLCDELQRVVIDALFCVGIMKVSLADAGDSANYGWNLKAGQPMAHRIDLDDFVFDAFAHDFREASFIGHRYQVPVAVAEKIYAAGQRDPFEEDFRPDFNPEGDLKINYVGRGTRRSESFEEMVTFWEIYLPRHKLVLTLADDPNTGAMDDAKNIIRIQKWIGPDCGPYHFLALGGWVPGSAMPMGPVMHLIDLHNAVNMCYTKLIEDTDRWKSVLPVPNGEVDDAGKLKQCANGEMFVTDARDLKEVQFGGPGEGVFRMAQHLKELFSWLAGNLDIVGGLSPQSKTAHQDEMLNQNSNKMIGDKQAKVISFTSSVGDAVLWYSWRHPEKVMVAQHNVQGVPEVGITRHVYPGGAKDQFNRPRMHQRNGDPPKIKVDPYTLSHSTPSQRLQFLNGFIQQSAQMMPLWAQQGVIFDASVYVDLVAKYGDEPEIRRLFTVADPTPPKQGGDQGGGMPANTSREYIRRGAGSSAAAQQADTNNMAASGSGFGGRLGAQS